MDQSQNEKLIELSTKLNLFQEDYRELKLKVWALDEKFHELYNENMKEFGELRIDLKQLITKLDEHIKVHEAESERATLKKSDKFQWGNLLVAIVAIMVSAGITIYVAKYTVETTLKVEAQAVINREIVPDGRDNEL